MSFDKKLTGRQFSLFAVVGGGQYILDAALLYFLLVLGMDIVIANLVSRTLVGVLGYVANRYITFRGTRVGLLQGFIRFTVAWLMTSVLSTFGIILALSWVTDGVYSPETGVFIKLAVEAVVFLLAFFIQKFWIFKH